MPKSRSNEGKDTHYYQVSALNDEGETIAFSTVEYTGPQRPQKLTPKFDRLGRSPEKVLYHYTDATALHGIVTKRELWVSHIRYLNDKEEFAHAAKLVIDHLHDLEKDAVPEELLNELKKVFQGKHRSNVFVFSLSEESDLLSQWRAYCPTGGFNIGFNVDALQLLAENEGFALLPCEYDTDAQVEKVKNFIVGAIKAFKHYVKSGNDPNEVAQSLARDTYKEFAHVAASIKHPSFEEEKEWRLIGHFDERGPQNRWRPASGMLLPYRKLSLPDEDVMQPFLSVIVSPSPHKQLSLESLNGFLQSNGINVPIKVSRSPYRTL